MRRNRALRGLIVLAIVVGAMIVAFEVWDAEKRSVERDNEALARRAAAAVVRMADFTAGSLRGAQGLLDFDGRMGRNRFRRFAREVLEDSTFETMTWSPRVMGPQRRKFVRNRLGKNASIVGIGREGTGTVPIGRKAVYYPVELVHPEDRVRRQIIGVDVSSDPTRSDAALIARDTGEPTATPPIKTVRTQELAVTVFQPLYRPGRKRQKTFQRRNSIRGFVTGTFYMRVLAQQVLEALPPGTEFTVMDGDQLVFDTGLGDNEYAKETSAGVIGRTWAVRAAGPDQPSKAGAFAIGLGGLLVAFLAALVFVLADRREARLEARRRGAELRSQRDALQARTADVLESGLTVRERMSALANELVPSITDFCIVDVEDGPQGWRRVGAAAADPDLRARLAAGRRVDGIPLGPNPGRAALLFDAEARTALVAGNETEGVDEVPVSSIIVLRLFARGRRVGLVLLGRLRRPGGRDFTADDMQQLRELGNRAALALDSARLYERERGTAETLQSHLLPSRLPTPRGIEAAAVYRAGGEGLHVGGDFYDLFPVAEGWVAVVGDVCGSGAEAASLTSLLRHTLRTGSRLSRPEHALALVDSAAREETDGRTFLTLAAAWLDDPPPGNAVTARVAVGGHPEPRIVRRDGSVQRIDPNGPLLGVVSDWSISTTEVTIRPGETLLLFTDGVTEARRDGELYGDERLDAQLARLAVQPLAEMLRAIEDDVVHFAGNGVGDDLAMLALRPRTTPPAIPAD